MPRRYGPSSTRFLQPPARGNLSRGVPQPRMGDKSGWSCTTTSLVVTRSRLCTDNPQGPALLRCPQELNIQQVWYCTCWAAQPPYIFCRVQVGCPQWGNEDPLFSRRDQRQSLSLIKSNIMIAHATDQDKCIDFDSIMNLCMSYKRTQKPGEPVKACNIPTLLGDGGRGQGHRGRGRSGGSDWGNDTGAACENVWLLARHWAMQMQRERASIPKVGLVIRSLDD